jgi:hypothetical protein
MFKSQKQTNTGNHLCETIVSHPNYITPRKLKIENKKAQYAAAYSNLVAREKALD